MSLSPGTTLGPYAVTAKIGEGGMGEVWQARDTKLDRDVALKVLPEAFTADPDRLARFEREAKVLASLNHPNIGSIYGLEEAEGVRALVLELVEGPTLADRIKQGPIPIDEALPIAKQIADALEAAHERGVIHRDLKPANIKVKDDGTVKVLDFGLAKAFQPDASDASASMSPTISLTAAATQMGMVIGTAAYMAPEQAKGKVVDKRADVWAFGAVLFEMLTGQKPFVGDDVSDTLALVLRFEPDWDALPPDTPARVRQLIRACLAKNPKQRLHDIADARLAMDGAFETSDSAVSVPTGAKPLRVWQRPSAIVAIGLALIAGGVLLGLSLARSDSTPPRGPVRLALSMPASDQLVSGRQVIALSPDGETLVYAAARDGVQQLYRRSLDQYVATPIPDTEGASVPFFSPDGLWVGFAVGRELKKTTLADGVTVTLTEGGSTITAARWSDNDTVVFSHTVFGLGVFAVSASGGEAQAMTTVDADQGELLHEGADRLPGGRALLLGVSPTGIAIQSLETGERRLLITEGEWPQYVSSGHILFKRDAALFAVPFDLEQLQITGEPLPLVREVLGSFSLAENGTLVYVTGQESSGRRLVWVDRDGREELLGAEPHHYTDLELSPDADRVALTVSDPPADSDIWIYDIARGSLTRLTIDNGEDLYPLWTQDGQGVVFSSTRAGVRNLFQRATDGTGSVERITTSSYQQSAWSWSPDAKLLLVSQTTPETGSDVVVVSMEGERPSEVLVQTSASDFGPAVSPDGNWLAYVSSTSGQLEVYVRPFPNVNDNRWQMSTDGGTEPRWGADGRELFYRTDSSLMTVSIDTEPIFDHGIPETVLTGDYLYQIGRKTYGIAKDGRFLMIKQTPTENISINVVLNWFEELKRLVPID